jgi:hypothetical protein
MGYDSSYMREQGAQVKSTIEQALIRERRKGRQPFVLILSIDKYKKLYADMGIVPERPMPHELQVAGVVVLPTSVLGIAIYIESTYNGKGNCYDLEIK